MRSQHLGQSDGAGLPAGIGRCESGRWFKFGRPDRPSGRSGDGQEDSSSWTSTPTEKVPQARRERATARANSRPFGPAPRIQRSRTPTPL